MSDLKEYNVIGCAGGEHCVCVDGYGHKKYAQTPIPQPLAEKDKHELVRIVEMMQEDVRWYVDQRNSLLAERDRLQEENRKLNEALDGLRKDNLRLRDALDEVRDLIDGYVDVVDGDYRQPAPNKAMKAIQIIEAARVEAHVEGWATVVKKAKLKELTADFFLEHETSYTQHKEWFVWECSCGAIEEEKYKTWEECHRATREHWAEKIRELLSVREARAAIQPQQEGEGR